MANGKADYQRAGPLSDCSESTGALLYKRVYMRGGLFLQPWVYSKTAVVGSIYSTVPARLCFYTFSPLGKATVKALVTIRDTMKAGARPSAYGGAGIATKLPALFYI